MENKKIMMVIALTLFLSVFATAVAVMGSTNNLKINEVLPNPDSGREWVEIYNDGAGSVNLSSCKLQDGIGTPLFLNGTIAGKGFLTFEYSQTVLNNAGDIVSLICSNITIDTMGYGDFGNLTNLATNPEKGKSVGRCSDGDDTNNDGDDFKVMNTTRSAKNDCGIQDIVCGDSFVDSGEECDDGNNVNGDGCSDTCYIEQDGMGCIEIVKETIVDGEIVWPIEQFTFQLDSDITKNNDVNGYAKFSNVAPGWHNVKEINSPSGWSLLSVTPTNGNVFVSAGEVCSTVLYKNFRNSYCGDGYLDENEDCDDGNNVNGDGCSDTCEFEEEEPYCGDGYLDENEDCDDGNNVNGDGCSDTCEFEEEEFGCIEIFKETLVAGKVTWPVPQFTFKLDSGITKNNDADGYARFDNVSLGWHTVQEIGIPSGWSFLSVTPTNGNVYVSAGEDCSAVLFKNKKNQYCGNGIVEPGEECDGGSKCSSSCRLRNKGTGIGVTINTEDFEPLVWQCDSRVVLDDAIEPGRISEDGEFLVERMNNYAFEGEQIQWKVLVMDKNGIEKIRDVYGTIGLQGQGKGNEIQVNCQFDGKAYRVDPSCNARILEESLNGKDLSEVAGYFTCTLTVETPESMHGEYWLTVEAEDLDGLLGTMDENEYWFLNPNIALGIEGDLVFDNGVRPGTSSYSDTILVENSAEADSGVRLDMFISGTDFYDSSSSGALCPTTNQLSLKAFSYFATNGAYSTQTDPRSDAEGYVPINYGIGFNDPKPFYNSHEITQSGPMNGPYYQPNILSPGAQFALTFRLNLPEPCNGDFDRGSIYFWGEAV